MRVKPVSVRWMAWWTRRGHARGEDHNEATEALKRNTSSEEMLGQIECATRDFSDNEVNRLHAATLLGIPAVRAGAGHRSRARP